MVLRAKKDMDQGDEVTLSYIDIALPEAQRNHKLVRTHSQKALLGYMGFAHT
jgi:hypothetical protein